MSYGPDMSEEVASKKLCSPLLEKEQSKLSHDSHMTFTPSQMHGLDEENDTGINHTRTTKSLANLLGLDYSSFEDES